MAGGYTLNALAEISGYTYRRLHDIDKLLPDGKKLFVKSEDGQYDLALFVQRWVQYNIEKASATEGKSLDDVKAEHELVKKRKTELEVYKLEGQLVDISDIRRLWGNIAHTVTQQMIRMPSKIAPRLVMQKSSDVIAAIIDEEVRSVLTQIAETPIPQEYADANETEDETEADE